jgi:hypothetical protein
MILLGMLGNGEIGGKCFKRAFRRDLKRRVLLYCPEKYLSLHLENVSAIKGEPDSFSLCSGL